MGGQPSKCDAIYSPLPQPCPPPLQGPSKPPRRPAGVLGEPEKPAEENPKKLPGGRSPTEPVEHSKELPHRYHDIVRQADKPPVGDLGDRKFSGIFLNQGKKKYWVDEETGCNCFMLFPRDLSITWSEDRRYWGWLAMTETSGVPVEVARVLNVCWLELHGTFELSYLTPSTTYEVAFVVMVEHSSYGWDAPVTLRLRDAQGNEQKHQESLADKPRGEWIELVAGELHTAAASAGEVEISLFEYEDGAWKRGLIVRGICIRPAAGWSRVIQLS